MLLASIQHDEVFDIFITPWQQVIERCFLMRLTLEYQRLFGGNSRNLVDPGKPDVPCQSACVFGHTCDRSLSGMLEKVRIPHAYRVGAEPDYSR